jgi:hypothetical protein
VLGAAALDCLLMRELVGDWQYGACVPCPVASVPVAWVRTQRRDRRAFARSTMYQKAYESSRVTSARLSPNDQPVRTTALINTRHSAAACALATAQRRQHADDGRVLCPGSARQDWHALVITPATIRRSADS